MTTVSRPGGTPDGPERQRDAERTRREILEVAIAEFARSGYSGARVDEIAARTSTTKRMIYYYFGGKEQLYIAALEQAYATARAAEQMDVDHLDPVSAMRTLAELTFDHHESHPDFVSLVAIENIHHGEYLAKSAAIPALNSPVVSVISSILERGYASGAFLRQAEALDIHLMISSFCFFRMSNRYSFGTIFGVDLLDPARRAHYRQMAGDMVVSYLTAPPRRPDQPRLTDSIRGRRNGQRGGRMVAVLVGFMGAGKTTVGHILAERLGQPFVDSDVLIEQRLGRNIRDIFVTEGETYFRELEHATVADLIRGQEAVIALGGGAVEDPRTRALLRNARVIYLRVDYKEAMARVQGDEYRPMLHRPDLDEVYQRRLPIYEDLSALTIDTDGRRPDAIAREVLAELTRLPTLPRGSSSVFVTPVGGTYYAHVGPGLTEHVSALLPALPEVERAMIIEAGEDEGVAARVAEGFAAAGIGVHRVALPDTQASKTFASAEYLADAFADHAMHRDDLVIAVGGEAICDIAGFVASTFNRGMRLALVPTTLAAQADSAVGGKNALNLGLGRNLVGTIHQPVVVISDIEVACANAGRGFKSGLAEIAKHALISPSDLLGYLHGARRPIVSRDPEAVCAAVTRSVEIKADIVSRDEREQGDRLFLNYGHTFAHAIELVRDSIADDQGESVALGMMAAAYLAFRQGRIPEPVVEQHRQTIAGLGLPVRGEFKLHDLQQAWLRDKKYRHGIRFVVLNSLGRPESGVTADEATLELVLSDLAG